MSEIGQKFSFSEWLLKELIDAYYEARKNGKRKTKNEHILEIIIKCIVS